MPLVQVYTDIESLITDKTKVAEIVHGAVKQALGKPDQYITVMVCRSECVTVGGQPEGVAILLESIGGDLNAFIQQVCGGLGQYGVDPSRVTATFRGVSFQEFAMNGAALG